jgi:hypothetical protein
MGTKRAEFRFYAELNDFLPRRHRFATVEYLFDGEVSVKDSIEATGERGTRESDHPDARWWIAQT